MTTSILTPREYVCPGQEYAIPRSVHLARIANGYTACRDCTFHPQARGTTLCFPRSASAPLSVPASTPLPPRIERLFRREGLRGVYRNELMLADAERFATALAAGLWEEAAANGRGAPSRGFPVVIGYDDRPWSIPLAVAAGEALRRSGCETIDVGLVTGPAFRFAVCHWDAAAGILATGAGGGPAVAGLDFASRGGQPMSAGRGLETLRKPASGRLTRQGGGRREFNANLPYEASLWRHFDVPSLVTAVVGTSSPLVQQRLRSIARTGKAKLEVIQLPRRSVDASGQDDAGLERIAAVVRESRSSFGMWIDEDGTACRSIDGRGRLMPVADVAALLIEDALADHPGATIAVDWALADQLGDTTLRRREVARSGSSAESMALTTAYNSGGGGVDSAGRLWRPGPPVSSDGLVMLARLLSVFGKR
jgi:hypothetical protein